MTASDRLRAAGFVRLPTRWVRGEDMPAIQARIDAAHADVLAIRHSERTDPREDIEAAWAAFERERG